MGRRSTTPRHPSEMGQLQEFKFSDPQWRRIAAEMGTTENLDQYRGAIEAAAASLVNAREYPEYHPGYRSSPRDRKSMSKVASSARRLVLALGELSGHARFDLECAFGAVRKSELPVDRGHKLRKFKADLAHMAAIAPYFSKAGGKSKLPANVDLVRNSAWAAAASWWERATGKKASAHEKSQAYKRKPPDGAFVRFLQAFTEAIPGEQHPTGDEIRGFIRAYWAKGKKEIWQMGEW